MWGHINRWVRPNPRVESEWDPHKPAFYFLPREVVLQASTKQLGRMQELRDSHELVKLVIDLKDAFQGKGLVQSILFVSHRWEDFARPDETGAQLAALQAHLRAHPEIRHVWFDYSCMPQRSSGCPQDQDDRTPAEKAEFDLMLSAIADLYLTAKVLILLDTMYRTRFWTTMEGWCAMQKVTPQGVRPARADESRVTVSCIHNATDEDRQALLKMSKMTPAEMSKFLASPDVAVTNKKDKVTMLPIVGKTDEHVQEMMSGIDGSSATLPVLDAPAWGGGGEGDGEGGGPVTSSLLHTESSVASDAVQGSSRGSSSAAPALPRSPSSPREVITLCLEGDVSSFDDSREDRLKSVLAGLLDPEICSGIRSIRIEKPALCSTMKARIGTKKCRIRVEVDESQLPQHCTASYSSDAAESGDSQSDTSVEEDIAQSISQMTKTRAWPPNIGVEDIEVVFKRFSSVLLVLLVHPVAAHVLFQLAKQRNETLLQESVRCCKLGGCVAQLDDRADIEDCVRKTCDAAREAISKMPEYQKEKQLITASSNSGGGDDGGGGSGGGGDAEGVRDKAPAAKKPKGKQKAEPDADVEDEAPAAKKTPWNAGRAARLAEDAAAASSTTLTVAEIQQFSQDLYDPKQNQLEDSVFEVLSQSLRTGDVADSGDLMLDLKEAIEDVEYPSGAVINHVGNLTKGVTEAQAARIWELYDHDGNGVMDRSELRRLVHDLGNTIIRRLSNKVERISKQMSKPKDSAKELLKALDKNRDGLVQKVEFVNLAIQGLGNIDAMTADERGGSSRGPPSKRTKVQDEARALKTARRGEPGFEMIHVRRS